MIYSKNNNNAVLRIGEKRLRDLVGDDYIYDKCFHLEFDKTATKAMSNCFHVIKNNTMVHVDRDIIVRRAVKLYQKHLNSVSNFYDELEELKKAASGIN